MAQRGKRGSCLLLAAHVILSKLCLIDFMENNFDGKGLCKAQMRRGLQFHNQGIACCMFITVGKRIESNYVISVKNWISNYIYQALLIRGPLLFGRNKHKSLNNYQDNESICLLSV